MHCNYSTTSLRADSPPFKTPRPTIIQCWAKMASNYEKEERTLAEFNQAGTRLNWSWSESFSEFENVLGDVYCTTWLEVLTDHFPEPLENKPKATRELKRCDKKENFYCRISIFICEVLGDQKSCDRQYTCYSPYGHKLFSGTGTAHMGNFSSPCPFRHGDSPYGYGVWCFCLPLSHRRAGALAKKPKFPTLPLRIPYGNGDSQIPILEWGLPVSIGDWNDIDTCSDMRITRDYHMVMGILKSPYGNGVSLFPYRDCKDINHLHENGDYQGLPYRNGDWHIPIWKWNLTITIWGSKTDQSPYQYKDYRTLTGTHSYTGTVQSLTRSWKEFVTIWGVQ